MAPLEPIPETVEAVQDRDPSADSAELLGSLRQLARRAEDVVPDLVGVSIARLDEGLTLTLVSTDDDVALLDGVQYASGGPCVDAAHTDEVRSFDQDDVLSEARWQLFAEATAARAVHSTLTLPVVHEEEVEGTVNLYAASRRAFVGHHDELADIFGAWAAGAVANADLSFTTRGEARAAPERVRAVIDTASEILAADLQVDVEAAEAHLRDAAARAAVSTTELARAIVESREAQRRDGD